MLDEVVRPNLKTYRLRPEIECLADIGADRKHPRVLHLGGPIVGYRRIDLRIPSALEIVAHLRLDIGLIDASPVSGAGKRHQMICEHAAEPWPLRVDERGCWPGRPLRGPQIRARRYRKLKDRTHSPNPLARVFRCEEKGSLQIIEPELRTRTRRVSDGQTRPRDQIPISVERNRNRRLEVHALARAVIISEIEPGRRLN